MNSSIKFRGLRIRRARRGQLWYSHQMQSIPVLSTNPRSGTHYLKNLLCNAAGILPLEQDLQSPDLLISALNKNNEDYLIYGHFRYSIHANILNDMIFPNLKMIILTRHPLDRLISQITFERACNGDLPNTNDSPQKIARDLILGLYDNGDWLSEKGISCYSEWHNFLLDDLVYKWINSPFGLLVKFEELIRNPLKELKRCLVHLQIKFDVAALETSVQKIDFKRLSGGRVPGQVDETSHYRSGLTDEWRNCFMNEDLNLLREKYGHAFKRCGYEL